MRAFMYRREGFVYEQLHMDARMEILVIIMMAF